jgi:hypothetical protein
MSHNPPSPKPDPNDSLPENIARMRVLLSIMELVAPLPKSDRLQALVGAIGMIDDTMAKLLAAKMGEKFR